MEGGSLKRRGETSDYSKHIELLPCLYIEDWVFKYFIMHQGVQRVKFQDNYRGFPQHFLWWHVFMGKKTQGKVRNRRPDVFKKNGGETYLGWNCNLECSKLLSWTPSNSSWFFLSLCISIYNFNKGFPFHWN